ncbi:MAG: cytochrome c oxidase accessory protein CcoG [Bacteroidales bacterium]|jgi:cytochrome c oxidase accessory protein FixG|nr:cytochrome c oxidase accessory protein CcoG [Bacteroidales bacterium]
MNQPKQNKKPDSKRQGSFRDHLNTIGDDGKRAWIYPKKPKGKLYNQRSIVASILLAVFFITPFIKYKGEPFMLFNIFERKFILFGQLFWPQDFHLVVLAVITFIVFIILFTVIFGRLWCGWTCPQTIFLEFVFRQIEYLIEGSFSQQKKLARQPWNFEKIWKKSLKHIVFFSIAFLVANTFLAYLIGLEELKQLAILGPIENLVAFVALLLFSGAFYFVFAFFREQVCLIACPYGRLQGVLLDSKSIIVAYDYKRGEPRGKHIAKEDRAITDKGDCIDCKSCIMVCPTGIDIRNGTQLECINCTACIDACDSVMDRVGLPKGLIRYDSEKGISEGKRSIFNARTIAYSAVLTILLITVGTLFTLRSDVEATILRVPATLFQEYGPTQYSNVYKIQLVNKTRADLPVRLELASHAGSIQVMGDHLLVKGGDIQEANFLVIMNKTDLSASNTPIVIDIFSDGKLLSSYMTTFIGPNKLDSK